MRRIGSFVGKSVAVCDASASQRLGIMPQLVSE